MKWLALIAVTLSVTGCGESFLEDLFDTEAAHIDSEAQGFDSSNQDAEKQKGKDRDDAKVKEKDKDKGKVSGAKCDNSAIAWSWRTPYSDMPLGSEISAGAQVIPYTYLLHVPEYLPEHPVPLLIAMHGLMGSGSQFAEQSRWAQYADQAGIIVAFPTGVRRWDTTEGSFDVGFIRDVVARIRSEQCIDPQRIWATGHSYGGFMTQRLACDAGDIFAAGAVVSGGDITLPGVGGPCDAGQSGDAGKDYIPVPLAFWHGTDDSVVPYNMGRTSYRKWLARYQCNEGAATQGFVYGALEVSGQCTRPDVLAREAETGQAFRLQFHTYESHAHGYPDGCGGLGEFSREECNPDPSAWPTLDSHHAEILDFLTSQVRQLPAVEQEIPQRPSQPEGSDPGAILNWINEYTADRRETE